MLPGGNPFDPQQFIGQAYTVAERIDLEGWKSLSTDDGIFVDESVLRTYRGAQELDHPLRQYGTAFADMHRELYDLWTTGDTVIVRLDLQRTHPGRLKTPFEGKMQKFDWYPESSSILTQLGVISNLGAALSH